MTGNKHGQNVLKDKLKALPRSPGVYLMKGAGDQILYIGKALVLTDRVRSYFQKGSALTPWTQSMVSQVKDIECLVTRTELEALILENNLIKKHRPKGPASPRRAIGSRSRRDP